MALNAKNANPCAILATLMGYEARLLAVLFTKWEALRRLAYLLEQAGDIAHLIPNPAYLIPLNMINLELYDRLRANCPMLNLPPADTSAIDDFRMEVQDAYYDLLRQLEIHPWTRMDELDRQLSNALDQIQPIRDWARCLSVICDTFGSADAAAYKMIKDQYNEIVESPGHIKSVLTESGRTKVREINAVKDQVKVLIDPASFKP